MTIEYIIKKNIPFGIPTKQLDMHILNFLIRNKKKHFKWEFGFHENCAYTVGNNYNGWNKLVGRSFYIWNAKKESIMIGWRWNNDSKEMELNTYSHINGKPIYTPPLASIQLNKTFIVEIELDLKEKNYIIRITTDTESKEFVQKFNHSKRKTREINPWFGGQYKPPHTMNLYKKRL